jgi:hypothetical protein
LVVFTRLRDTLFLTTTTSGQKVTLSWSASYQGFVLKSATTVVNGGDWRDSDLTTTTVGDQNVVNLRTTNAAGFFRLRK